MKVTQDAFLFGAWLTLVDASHILDVGTGTGLLALMAAQKCQARIDALEIDADAAQQALENAASSRWRDRISVLNTSLQQFSLKPLTQSSYDHIICNPPFYDQATKPRSAAKRIAWHNDLLSLEELISSARDLLTASGSLHLMIPFALRSRLENACQLYGVCIAKETEVRSYADRLPHRLFAVIRRGDDRRARSELIVFQRCLEYTNESRTLLQSFSIKL